MSDLAPFADLFAKTTITGWGLLILASIALIKAWPSLKKIKSDSDASLRADLLARIAALETKVEDQDERLERERRECDTRIDRQEERHEKAMSKVETQFTLMRHDRNNLKQVVTFMITSIKKTDNIAMREIAEAAEEMLARGETQLALEKGAAASGRL